MAELKLELHSPLTEEDWDLITDADLDHTPSVTFHTKHGKDVEYVKVKHGKWIYVKTITNGEKEYKCSECNASLYCYGTPKQAHYKYCYMCGAKMDEVEE